MTYRGLAPDTVRTTVDRLGFIYLRSSSKIIELHSIVFSSTGFAFKWSGRGHGTGMESERATSMLRARNRRGKKRDIKTYARYG